MRDADLRTAVLYEICRDTAIGWRTNELVLLYRYLHLGRRMPRNSDDAEWYECLPRPGEMRKLIEDLLKEKKIRAVADKDPSGHCWLVSPRWSDTTRFGSSLSPKVDCTPFGFQE